MIYDSLGPITEVQVDTVVLSKTIKPGKNGVITISNDPTGTGKYKKNKGAATADDGTVVESDIINAVITSSADDGKTVTMTLTIDGTDYVFNVKTKKLPGVHVTTGGVSITTGGVPITTGA